MRLAEGVQAVRSARVSSRGIVYFFMVIHLV